MKELKNYLHLYMGCECFIGDLNWKPETNLHDLAPGVDPNFGKPIRTILDAHALNVYSHMITPILRPLSDMTEEDVDLGDFIPEFDILVQRYTGGYYVELDSIHDDGYCLTIYPDGSMYCICKDNMENYPYKGGDLFNQLLSKGFDLFNLIDAGLAVSKTETK